MTRVVHTLLLLSLLPAASRGSSFVKIRGVAPADQGKFLASEFSCVVGGKATNLPIRRVNDDFCDCDDGQDEPATAACSHLISSEFYCENDGFFPGKIHTSRVHDGICDCCDGSDEEFGGGSPCPSTCATAAESFRQEAEQRLQVVTIGFGKRQAAIDGEVANFFHGEEQAETTTEKELKKLVLLKERVTVHKDREELREKKYRMEVARQKHVEGHSAVESGGSGKQQFSDAAEREAVEALEFEGLDAIRVADDEVPVDSQEDERASEVLDSRRATVKSLIELPDGTRISLADYLRLDHSKQSPTKKRVPRTAEQMQREDFLGPLFNGGAEGRKKIGLYGLRVIGIVISPVRGLVELVLFSPRTLWGVLSTPEVAGSAIAKLPDFPSPSRSIWFRQLGGGSVYDSYSSVMWGARVVWDAPIYAYQYLFPKLDEEVKLPVAESLRKVLHEIDTDITKLEKERNEKREAAKMDYGPDRAYFSLKDKCIEKRIEKYEYKFCAFGEVKQDRTKLGKWDGWAVDETNDSSNEGEIDHTKMRYSKGQRCYKGPERSVFVYLNCGEDNEILSVDEPSTCVYEMTVRSPLACTAQVLAKAQKDVEFWTRRQ
ncbi:hypothetical protein PRNP1_002051 [Phytophthora ramorum]